MLLFIWARPTHAHASLFSLPLPPTAGARASAASVHHCRNRGAPLARAAGGTRSGCCPPLGARPHAAPALHGIFVVGPPSPLCCPPPPLKKEPPVVGRFSSPSRVVRLARPRPSAAHAFSTAQASASPAFRNRSPTSAPDSVRASPSSTPSGERPSELLHPLGLPRAAGPIHPHLRPPELPRHRRTPPPDTVCAASLSTHHTGVPLPPPP
jgi:hypothetical protein